MTELNLAYGYEDNLNSMEGGFNSIPKKNKQEKAQYVAPVDNDDEYQQQPQQHQQSQPQQHQQSQQQVKETFQNQYSNYESKKTINTYSFWDRMVVKRPEVVKLAMFSLVIILAISLEKVFSYYLTKYLSDNIFSDMQELLIRMAYPIVIFLTLWIVKSM